MLKVSKYQFIPTVSQITFRTESSQLVQITKDNITDELVALAEKAGRGHCFQLVAESKNQKKSQSTPQLNPALSILNEVKIEESDLLPAQGNKRESSETPAKKKSGRPPKSKE
jgi:hypothetical protein